MTIHTPAAAFQPEAQHVAAVITAAQAMLDAFGGDVPDWLEREAATLQSALGGYWAQREQVTAPAKVEITPDVFAARADYHTASGIKRFMLLNVAAFSLAEATRKAREEFDRRTKGRARRVVMTVTLSNDPIPTRTTIIEDDA